MPAGEFAVRFRAVHTGNATNAATDMTIYKDGTDATLTVGPKDHLEIESFHASYSLAIASSLTLYTAASGGAPAEHGLVHKQAAAVAASDSGFVQRTFPTPLVGAAGHTLVHNENSASGTAHIVVQGTLYRGPE